MLPEKYASTLSFLSEWGVEFGRVLGNINAKDKTLLYIAVAFFIVLVLKNSTHIKDNFKADTKTLIFLSAILSYALLNLNNVSEFLYFNF